MFTGWLTEPVVFEITVDSWSGTADEIWDDRRDWSRIADKVGLSADA